MYKMVCMNALQAAAAHHHGCVSVLHHAGPRETCWLAPHRHYLHSQWHRRQSFKCYISAIPRGGSCVFVFVFNLSAVDKFQVIYSLVLQGVSSVLQHVFTGMILAMVITLEDGRFDSTWLLYHVTTLGRLFTLDTSCIATCIYYSYH